MSSDLGQARDRMDGPPQAFAAGASPAGAALPDDLVGIDLSGADLAGVDLSGRDLSGANLAGANLTGARLVGATLRGAILAEAVLDEAQLLGCDLSGADLTGASASHAVFGRADLSGAVLFDAQAADASFSHALLGGADLRVARLDRARFLEAVLDEADLSRATLQEADLTRASVDGAIFRDADLARSRVRAITGYAEADWIGVDILDVDFAGAYLARRAIMDQNYLHEFRTKSRLNRLVYLLWWVTSDCGRSIVRWSLWTNVVALVFALAYTMVDIDFGAHPTPLSPVYFSVVTLTTLGYGDVLPASMPAQILAMVEVVLGYVMLGGLLSIFATKMGRRAE
jgi:uncharacterized protein YjbI with pentapeptide repeats